MASDERPSRTDAGLSDWWLSFGRREKEYDDLHPVIGLNKAIRRLIAEDQSCSDLSQKPGIEGYAEICFRFQSSRLTAPRPSLFSATVSGLTTKTRVVRRPANPPTAVYSSRSLHIHPAATADRCIFLKFPSYPSHSKVSPRCFVQSLFISFPQRKLTEARDKSIVPLGSQS